MADEDESWGAWLRGGEPFVGQDAAAFEREEAETNDRRLRVMLPLMAAASALGAISHHVPAHRRGALAVEVLGWRDASFDVNLALTVVYAALALALWRGVRIERLAAATGLAFLVNGAGLAAITIGVGSPELPWFRNLLMTVVLVALPPGRNAAVLAAGWVALALAGVAVGAEAGALRSLLVSGGLTAAAGAAFGAFLHGARRRDFRLRLTVEKQARELAELNGRLEQRVAEQVAALVARAEEVERLNAQLTAQVKDRSQALARALRRLAAQSPGQDDDLEGALLGGRFRVGARIAVGGMGAVYEGIDTTTDQRVAIKVIRASASAPLALLERFLREARSAASVDHPAVVRMLHVDIDDDGLLYQVQEYVEGETMRDALERAGRFAPAVAARAVAALADALDAAHAAGVVHRDVKPANVILTRAAPGLRLVDFGISKVGWDESMELTAHGDATLDGEGGATRTGAVMGTPRFMSPEQRVGASRVGAPTDVYALGVLAHLAFTGVYPGKGGAPLPDEVAGLIVGCLDDDPARRPSAAEVFARLTAFADASGAGPLESLVAGGALGPAVPRGDDDAPTSHVE